MTSAVLCLMPILVAMSEVSLAIRNLLRNRRRSLSTILALAIGLTSILLFGGFKTNIRYSMLTAYVRTGGHLQVQHRDFFTFGSGNPSAYGIRDYQSLLGRIQNDSVLKPLVSVTTPMLRFSGLAGNFDAGISRTVVGTGYVAPDINRMRLWNEFAVPIAHPVFKLEGAENDAAIIGVGVAKVLQLCVELKVQNCPVPAAPAPGATAIKSLALPDDIAALAQIDHSLASDQRPTKGAPRIELLSSSGRGAPNVTALSVIAAEDQGFKELDEIAVIIHFAYAQQLVFGRTEPRATAIMVQLNDSSRQGIAADRLRAIVNSAENGQPLVVRDVEELNPFYVQSIQLFDMIFGFIFVLIGGIVLFTVGNTMNAAVIERTVEIGTLRAIGLRQGGIRRLFTIEGFILGCVGSLVGSLCAILVSEVVNRSGLTWLPPGSSERLPLQLRVAGEFVTILSTAVALTVIATVSALVPAWRAARLNVVEALRHA